MRRSIFVLSGMVPALVVFLVFMLVITPVYGAAAAPSSRPQAASPGLQWAVEVVDPVKTFENSIGRSLALDSAGHAHLVYGNDHVIYAHYDGLAWHFKTVDTVGGYAALALDAAGQPHISYYDPTNGSLRYAHLNGAAWLTETVDDSGDVGKYTSIALDSSGRPHISYYDITNTGLKYASFGGTAWVIEQVDGAGDVGQYSSLALDSANRAHIAYYGGGHLKYTHFNGSAWQALTVDAAAGVGKYASIALDGSDHPQVAYYDETNQDVKYAIYNGTAWQKQVVDADAAGGHASLALDSNGQPYIAYSAPGAVKTAHYVSSAWQFDSLPNFGADPMMLALALDSADRPTLAAAQTPELRVFTFDGAGWQDEMIDFAGYNGGFNDIVLDEFDRPHISYCVTDDLSSNYYFCDYLKVAAFDGLDWQMTFIDSGGYNSSIALDSAGNAHISYMTNDTLKYAHFDGAAWQTEAVEVIGSSNGVNLHTSLALDSADLPHISYCGYIPTTCGYLKYAHFDGTQWNTETVDNSGLVGNYNAIAVDSFDHPHISHMWSSGHGPTALKYAFFDGGAWLSETVVNNGWEWGGDYGSIALDPDDHPRVVHYAGNRLDLSSFDGYAWQTETAVPSVNALGDNSLGINSLNQPCFSYVYLHVYVGHRVEYACKDASGWHTELVDYLQDDRDYVDLALDSLDRAHISYDSISLKYAHQVPIPLSGVTIQGPAIVGIGMNAEYAAIPIPSDAFEPITYSWSNGSRGPTATYSWAQPGMHNISVTASNSASVVTGSLTVLVQNRSNLPIVFGPPFTGSLSGRVVSAVDGYTAIPGASVCVVAANRCVITEQYGQFDISGILEGNQLIHVSADGYLPDEFTVAISHLESVYRVISLTPLVQTGNVAGQVVSAVTGLGVGGASVCLTSGSPCATTDGAGNYTLTGVPTGSQTVRASANGYFSFEQAVQINPNQTASLNFVLSPTLATGEMRIVLTWGADPRDLDSHLWLPSSHPFHIYYGLKGNCSASPFACLDVDDQYSYGPETTTIHQRYGGTYRYAIHKFTGSGTLTTSGAQVKVYDSSGLIATYNVPTSGSGDWWYLFDLDGNTGAITLHNIIQNASPAPY